jgi:UDP-N-acetyl-D-mannosaminuronate dehydrogenase
MAELCTFKEQVKDLLKSNDRCDIDRSKILKVYEELTTDATAQDVYDKLIEMFPEKKCFNHCKKVTDDEFFNNFGIITQ